MAPVRRLAGARAGALALAAVVPAVARAQTGRVTGRVVDSTTRQGIAGVNVRVDGTAVGTQTGPDGSFVLGRVPAGARSIRVARIGFTAQTRPVDVAANGTATVNFALGVLAARLTEVVAVAYSSGGAESRRNVTGSVAAVDSSQFNKGRIVSPEDLIAAKVPGVQVVNNTEPGGSVTVRIRGGTSITASNDPLFVVDGLPLPVGGGLSAGRNPLNFLNPQDIANVTVLKDAQATAIYGSRGSNGVVLITTKNGSTGGAQISYGSNVSSSTVAREPQMLNAAQLRAAVQQYAPSNDSLLGTANTNWFDAIRRTGVGQEHNFAVGGTRQDLRYRLSLGYLNQAGVLQGDQTRRLTGALNYSDQLFSNLVNLDASVRGTHTRDAFGASQNNILGDALGFLPTQPITTSAGTYYQFGNILAPNNPLSRLALINQSGNTDRGLGNLQVRTRLPFLEGLSATVRGSFDAARTSQTTFIPTTDRSQLQVTNPGSFYQNLPDATTLVLDVYGNYARRVDRYAADVDVTGGYSYETFRGNNASYQVYGLTTNSLGTGGIPAATQVLTPSLNIQESRLASFFGRANLTVQDRYLLGLSLRRDASSRFGINNQWGTFPAVSVGWRLSDESFLKNRVPGLTDLKLRYSYGLNGNQAFPNYLAISTYFYSTTLSQTQFGNVFVPTLQPGAANPNLKWEQTRSHDAGVDYGLFGGRVTGTLDYYNKKTSDLLFRVPVAAGTNFGNYVTQNVGSLRNAGFEFGLTGQVLRGQGDGPVGRLRYDANFNAAFNRNRVLQVSTAGGASQIASGALGFVNLEIIRPGLPVNTFFVYQHRTGSDGRPVTGPSTVYDTTHYVDQNHDGQINQADLVPFHDPAPKWILGHTSTFGYGRADLSFTLRANLGNYVYNAMAANSTYSVLQGGAPRNVSTAVYNYNFVNAQPLSDLYVENGSFLRMDNITVGYTLPRTRALRNTRVFATAQNVFTITGYSGLNPQVNNTTNINGYTNNVTGIDNSAYPLSRVFTAGFNVGF